MPKKAKWRYAKRKKNTERNVISYEDMPLDDYEQEKTDISPAAVKKIIMGVCIALAAGLIVFGFANRDKLTWENISAWWSYDVLGNAGGGYPVNVIGTDVAYGNISVNQGRVSYASDTSFVTLNSTGSEIANIQLRYSKPVMKSAENRFLTYGIGSDGYQIQSFDKKLYSGDMDEAVHTGDISSNGVYCLVTEGNGYLSTLYVFNENNNRIFKYSFSEYYINFVALNPDGTGCIAAGITTDGGAVKTGIYVLDFKEEKPASKYEIKNNAIVDGKYLSSSRVALVGQNSAYIIKIGENKPIDISYEDKTIANYCFNRDTRSFAIALSRSGDGRNCNIVVLNDNGEKTLTKETNSATDSLSMYKGTIAQLDGNTAYLYDGEGNVKYTHYTETGSKRLLLASDTTAYVLSINQVRFIDFNNPSTGDTASGKE